MSEVRLIDAGALMERFAEMQKVKPDKDGREYACNFIDMGGEPSAEWFTVEDAVENAPTVDAVPVVRKPIRGYEGMYEVDNLARVFSVERIKTVNDNGRVYDKPIRAKQLRQGLHSKGYKVVTLTKDGVSKTHFVHRLVADAFIENPNGLPMINHKDEDKTNNLPGNLEWCDAQYNATYGNAIRKRVRKIVGVKHTDEHNAKISESLKKHYETHESKSNGRQSEKRKQIVAVDESGNETIFSSSYEAAEKTGVDRRNIFACCRGKKKRLNGYKFNYFCADGERRSE